MNDTIAAKHTPGPWEVTFEGHRLSVFAKGYGFIHTHEVPHVNTGATATANANSRLIAAAPELLEACKAIRSRGICEVTKLLCEQAIAKAEGRS